MSEIINLKIKYNIANQDVMWYTVRVNAHYGRITMSISYDRLWKLLIDRKMNRTQLRLNSGISSNSLAKLGKNEPVNLEVLLKICECLKVPIESVVEFVE